MSATAHPLVSNWSTIVCRFICKEKKNNKFGGSDRTGVALVAAVLGRLQLGSRLQSMCDWNLVSVRFYGSLQMGMAQWHIYMP